MYGMVGHVHAMYNGSDIAESRAPTIELSFVLVPCTSMIPEAFLEFVARAVYFCEIQISDFVSLSRDAKEFRRRISASFEKRRGSLLRELCTRCKEPAGRPFGDDGAFNEYSTYHHRILHQLIVCVRMPYHPNAVAGVDIQLLGRSGLRY